MARLALGLFALAAAPAMAQFNEAIFFQAIPTLDEIGLGALIAIVAAAAGWAIRRSKRK
ncbi:MAG TPA: IPTL-CTERM sorting domain-containing protein [Casimicrobiaceae bacterium]|jgi:hypothetical protein|nr:IPTL-CTERM sorting domain-containing protein [Casimicrobiaceae bacterium]